MTTLADYVATLPYGPTTARYTVNYFAIKSSYAAANAVVDGLRGLTICPLVYNLLSSGSAIPTSAEFASAITTIVTNAGGNTSQANSAIAAISTSLYGTPGPPGPGIPVASIMSMGPPSAITTALRNAAFVANNNVMDSIVANLQNIISALTTGYSDALITSNISNIALEIYNATIYLGGSTILATAQKKSLLDTAAIYGIIPTTTTPPTPVVISSVCFPANTPVTTDQGIVMIDKLDSNVHTIRNQKIVAITKTITQDKTLVKIEKNAFSLNCPSVDTTMSQNHKIMYKGKMIKAKELIGFSDEIKQVEYNGEVLYNVLMDEHSKMIINNLIVETMHPGSILAKIYSKYHFDKLSTAQQLLFAAEVNKIVLSQRKQSGGKVARKLIWLAN